MLDSLLRVMEAKRSWCLGDSPVVHSCSLPVEEVEAA